MYPSNDVGTLFPGSFQHFKTVFNLVPSFDRWSRGTKTMNVIGLRCSEIIACIKMDEIKP